MVAMPHPDTEAPTGPGVLVGMQKVAMDNPLDWSNRSKNHQKDRCVSAIRFANKYSQHDEGQGGHGEDLS
jgi:hypothetical protein